jgi:hypothetical protein
VVLTALELTLSQHRDKSENKAISYDKNSEIIVPKGKWKKFERERVKFLSFVVNIYYVASTW